MQAIKCWFKRTTAEQDWENGEAYQFEAIPLGTGSISTQAILTAKKDGATLAIPIERVYFTDENPDKIKEKLEKAEAKEKEPHAAAAHHR
jgi:hypothetical protein